MLREEKETRHSKKWNVSQIAKRQKTGGKNDSGASCFGCDSREFLVPSDGSYRMFHPRFESEGILKLSDAT